MIEQVIERLFEVKGLRAMVSTIILLRGGCFGLIGNVYRASVDYCWLYRVSGIEIFRRCGLRLIMVILRDGLKSGVNPIRTSFLRSKEADRAREKYSLSGKGDLDIFRDVIVLKGATADEKGVLLIKYTPTFDAFMAFFDVDSIMDQYYVVLEPSWVGACDPSILMFISTSGTVVVETPEMTDYHFVASLNANLRPIVLGSGDWVDGSVFSGDPSIPKKYDLIMVANWGRFKRHLELFKALERIQSRSIKVMLIGFPWGGRTRKDIEEEMNRYDLRNHKVEIRENLRAQEVSQYLNQSKALVLLSRKEGPNKAIVEGLFANVPAIVYENFVGGARAKINWQTGILSSYEDLPKKIEYMLDHLPDFSPRAWALQNTGSRNASFKLESLIQEIATEKNEKWIGSLEEKVNVPNLAYKNRQKGDSGAIGYKLMQKYLRSSVSASL